MAISTGKVVALIQAMGSSADPAVIESAVQDWLDNHPEATTTVQDGSITEQKLASAVAAKLAEVTDLKSAIEDINEELYVSTEVVAGGSTVYADDTSFSYGSGNIRWITSTFESDYNITKIKVRAYKNASAEYKFKLATISYESNQVYVRSLSSEYTDIALDPPTDTYKDYEIELSTPFTVPAGMMIAFVASDNNWFRYNDSTGTVTYVNRTETYSNVIVDFKIMAYLPSASSTGTLPVTFYSGGKEIKHIYTEEEIAEIAEEHGVSIDNTLTQTGEAADAKATGDAIEALSDEIGGEIEIYKNLISDKNSSQSGWQSGVWGNASEASISTNGRYISYKTYLEDVDLIINNDTTKYKYGIIAHDLNETYPGKGWYDVENDAFTRYQYLFITSKEFDLAELKAKYPKYSFTISVRRLTEVDMNVSEYQCISFVSYRSYSKKYEDNIASKNIYVSTLGDDTNAGTDSNHPVLTINHAIELGASRILIAGGNYTEQIDISKTKGRKISIESYSPTSSPIIYAPGCKIAETESAVSGYTKVYSASTEHEFPSTTSKIFIEGIADASTEIDDDDRHPLQRGLFYRCSDTMITRCTATILSDALSEIEESDQYKWFYNNGTIYFSRPESVSSSHPLMTGLYDNTLFANATARNCSIEMSGLVIKYARVDLGNFSNAKMSDCRVFGGCGGGIMYNHALSLELVRCDVSRAYSGSLGDGICATGLNTYGQAYGTTVTMIDCWVHDNNDDGFSDHVGCESTIIGGLYEHNGKGGVLPTGGGSCTCYNVESRYNAFGFEIAGTSADDSVASGRNGQQMTCFGCLADHNSEYGYFVASNKDMTMKLVGCRSTNNDVGYGGPYNVPSSDMIAIDCSSYGDNTAKSRTVTVINTQVLT